MSTYSPDLRIQLISTGDQAGTWGNTTNTNMGGIIENAIAGVQSVVVTATSQALTALYGAVDQAQGAVLSVTTTLSSNFSIFAPPNSKQYTIYNNTSYVLSIYVSTVLGNTTPKGTPISIPANGVATVWTDGTNFYPQNNYFPTALNINGSVTATNHIGAGTGLTGTASGLSIGGNAATATSATSATSATTATTSGTCSGNAATATAPASGGSFITSSNIGSQSVSYASSAGSASTAGSLSSTLGVSGGGTGATSVAGILSTLGFAGQSLGNPGYYYLPNGVLVQWASNIGWATVSFPITFPNSILVATAVRYSGSGSIGEFGVTYNNSTITPASNGNTGPWSYIALGH